MAAITLGSVAVLSVRKRIRAGLMLDGGELGELLLPAKEVQTGSVPDSVRVFVYADGNGRPRASARMPRLLPGGVGRLEVVSVGGVGAGMGLVLPEDVLL